LIVPLYKKPGCPDGMYRVGPLGRLNVVDRITTPLAGKEFKEFKRLSNTGIVEGSLYYHYARMIECLYAAERIKVLAEDELICSTEYLGHFRQDQTKRAWEYSNPQRHALPSLLGGQERHAQEGEI